MVAENWLILKWNACTWNAGRANFVAGRSDVINCSRLWSGNWAMQWFFFGHKKWRHKDIFVLIFDDDANVSSHPVDVLKENNRFFLGQEKDIWQKSIVRCKSSSKMVWRVVVKMWRDKATTNNRMQPKKKWLWFVNKQCDRSSSQSI